MLPSPFHSLLDPSFRSAAACAIFSDERRLQCMLNFEAALARAEATTGIIPVSAAEAIGACCVAERFDREALTQGAVESGNLAIPMIAQLTKLVREQSPEAAAFVHWGATSQDAIDTGLMLQMRDSLELLEEMILRTSATLAGLANQHRDTPMVGRTWLQHAVPIPFGGKVAGWLDALLRHRQRLLEIRPRMLVLQFGGAAGTLASLGSHGTDVAQALASELGLTLPVISWHAHRDRIGEFANLHGLLAGTTAKIARDLSLMMQSEVGEVAEPAADGRGGSSTMPHKRNPVAMASVLAGTQRVFGLVSTVLASSAQEHERGLGGWQAEWDVIPDLCTLTLGALERLAATLEGLEINSKRMRTNLEMTGGQIFAEAVSMALAEKVGKAEAHHLLEQASREAIAHGKGLRASIDEAASITRHLSSSQLDAIFDPANAMGDSGRMIDAVLAEYRRTKGAD